MRSLLVKDPIARMRAVTDIDVIKPSTLSEISYDRLRNHPFFASFSSEIPYQSSWDNRLVSEYQSKLSIYPELEEIRKSSATSEGKPNSLFIQIIRL